METGRDVQTDASKTTRPNPPAEGQIPEPYRTLADEAAEDRAAGRPTWGTR